MITAIQHGSKPIDSTFVPSLVLTNAECKGEHCTNNKRRYDYFRKCLVLFTMKGHLRRRLAYFAIACEWWFGFGMLKMGYL